MNLVTMVWKNLWRRRVRTGLTLVGIAVGIAAVVALTGFARGLESGWRNTYEARGTDVVITKVASRSPVPTHFAQAALDDVVSSPPVTDSAGLLSDIMGIELAPTMFVFGWEFPSFLWDHLTIQEGRLPSGEGARELMLGALAARTLEKQVGDTVQVEFEQFTVVGVYQSAALVETGAIIMPLGDMQRATDRDGQVNFINVRLADPETSTARLRERLESLHPGFSALGSSEVASRNSGVEVAQAMSFATSLIALVVGAFGVTNTMLMSVFERTREIGILLAIGWKRWRVMSMILLESLLLALAGGALGTVGGLIAARMMEQIPLLRGRLQAEVSVELFVIAFVVATGLGCAAGLYPAWRAAQMQPSDALRAE
jgi:putative ABC transport system permease protein